MSLPVRDDILLAAAEKYQLTILSCHLLQEELIPCYAKMSGATVIIQEVMLLALCMAFRNGRNGYIFAHHLAQGNTTL